MIFNISIHSLIKTRLDLDIMLVFYSDENTTEFIQINEILSVSKFYELKIRDEHEKKERQLLHDADRRTNVSDDSSQSL